MPRSFHLVGYLLFPLFSPVLSFVHFLPFFHVQIFFWKKTGTLSSFFQNVIQLEEWLVQSKAEAERGGISIQAFFPPKPSSYFIVIVSFAKCELVWPPPHPCDAKPMRHCAVNEKDRAWAQSSAKLFHAQRFTIVLTVMSGYGMKKSMHQDLCNRNGYAMARNRKDCCVTLSLGT